MKHLPSRRRLLLATASVWALGACSTVSTVSIDVSSQGPWPAGRAAGTYAIERLPSQQANPLEQARIEAAALPALAAAGFTAAPAEQADMLVQIGARAFEVVRRDPFAGPFGGPFGWRSDWWFYGGRRPFFYGPHFGYSSGYDTSEVQREVAVLVRDRRSQQIVYETRATYLQRWNSEALLPALFEAAMKDFPQPAISPRTVIISLPRG